MKLSEQAIKISTPGIQQVRRFRDERGFLADMIYNTEEEAGMDKEVTMIDPLDFTKRRRFDATQSYKDLLVPIFDAGNCVYELPDIHSVRARVQTQLAGLHPGRKALCESAHLPSRTGKTTS